LFAERSYPAHGLTPSTARHFTLDSLNQLLGPDLRSDSLVDDVALVISELATNAIAANAATTVTVSVTIDDHQVRLAVFDDGTGVPEIQRPSDNTEGGRGLLMVDQLSHEWGVFPSEGGKQVWATFALPSPGGHHGPLA
jgi:anti-sigma regulatory factor (Ser/Thr protein kinase)